MSRAERDSGLVAPHPYAAPGSAQGYRNTYGRSSPQPPNGANGNGGLAQHPNNSESFMYGQAPGKTGTESREGTTAGTRQDGMNGQSRGMGVYDRDQMARVGEQDEHGLGRKKGGFWAAFCCRA